MPFDPTSIPQALVDAVVRRDVVPLVGSGLSKQSSPRFPNWRELLTQLAERAREEDAIRPAEARDLKKLIVSGQFLMAAEHLRRALPTDVYRGKLEDAFSLPGVAPSAAHRALLLLHPPMIMTTNYDRLIEDAYAREYGRSAPVWTYAHAGEVQRAMQRGRLPDQPPIIFKLHGTIDDPSGIILTEGGYRELVYRQAGYRMIVSAVFLTRVVLMVGFSADDPELRLLLDNHREALKGGNTPDYAFMPDNGNQVWARRLREDFGIHVIPYRPDATHSEVRQFLEYLAARVEAAPPPPVQDARPEPALA